MGFWRKLVPFGLFAAAACGTNKGAGTGGTKATSSTTGMGGAGACPSAVGTTGTGVPDCNETDLSDPNEQGFACGWADNDPENLTSDGNKVGNVIQNIPLIDQCKSTVPLWDLAGQYHILFMTAAW